MTLIVGVGLVNISSYLVLALLEFNRHNWLLGWACVMWGIGNFAVFLSGGTAP